MIITKAPLRVSFAGGGSDLPVYYRANRGAVLSAAINKYIYISIHPYFNRNESLLKYSRNELVRSHDEIQHPIFRETLRELLPSGGVEIVSTADVPAGTGLGSSSSFTVALYCAAYAYRSTFCSKEKLARKACEMEIDRLGEPIGKQDQYAAAYGGLNFIEFLPDETVVVTPLVLKRDTIRALEQNLLMFYIFGQREARSILADQSEQVSRETAKRQQLGKMVELAYRMRENLIEGNIDEFGRGIHEGWMLKRTLSARIATDNIDRLYERALSNGAIGGKLLGAGGGGFLLLYCRKEEQEKLRRALSDCREMKFGFDWGGASVIYVGTQDSE